MNLLIPCNAAEAGNQQEYTHTTPVRGPERRGFPLACAHWRSNKKRAAMTNPTAPAPRRTLVDRFLDGVEKIGNKLPDPVMIFIAICALVLIAS
ncbi:MAG: AbgT family transporter, partial [Ottowia sp.]|nr:AbgT family transporter [Ottowia sp.]